MRLLRIGAPGSERPAMLDREGRIRDLSSHIADIDATSLAEGALARLEKIDPASLPLVEGNVRTGPCLGKVGHLIAVGLNYADHAAEANRPLPDEPLLFNKAATSVSGPDDDIVLPRGAEKGDWELELAVVIGRDTYDVDEAAAREAIAGYCICNDVSERAFQIERGGQWMKGKSAPTFAPLGPLLVTPDEIADVQDLDMELTVNGVSMQKGSTAGMIFSAVKLVSYISRFMRLAPGDVITTGTPAGIGHARKPPVYLRPGDSIVASIKGLGQQRNMVRAAPGSDS